MNHTLAFPKLVFCRSVRISFFLITIFCSFSVAATTTGKVLETMDAADYTYLNVETANQNVWVAIPATAVKKGDTVTYEEGMVMQNFQSKTLGKTFEAIVFSPGLQGQTISAQAAPQETKVASSSFSEAVKQESQPPQTGDQALGKQSTSGSAGATVPFMELKIDKAEGENSYTVGEIFAKAAELDGQKVRLRAKVVKVSPNIMGKNWIHLQDGTGDPMQNSHDLVVTSTDMAAVDQIVLVEGIGRANKDFGFGYKYDAMLEEATVQTK